MPKTTIDTDNITLLYSCKSCNVPATQPLTDIVSCGTLICPECGDDMELSPKVEINLPETKSPPNLNNQSLGFVSSPNRLIY